MSSDDFYHYPPPNDDGYTTDGGESVAGSIFSEASSMEFSWHFGVGRGRPRGTRGRPAHSGRERGGGRGRGRGEIVGGRGGDRQSDVGSRMESQDVRSKQSTLHSTGGPRSYEPRLGGYMTRGGSGSGPFGYVTSPLAASTIGPVYSVYAPRGGSGTSPGGSTPRGSAYQGAPRGRRPGDAPWRGRAGYAPRGAFRAGLPLVPVEETFERTMILTEDGVEKILREITLDNVTVVTIIARRDVKSCRKVIVRHKASLLSKMNDIEKAYGVGDSEESEIFTEYEENEQKKKEKVQKYMEGKRVEEMNAEVQHDLIEDTDVRTGAYLMYHDEDHELLLVCFRNLARAINRSDFKVAQMVRLNFTVYPQAGTCRVKVATECTDFKQVRFEIGNALDTSLFNPISIFHKFDVLRHADIRKQTSDDRPTRRVIGRVTSSKGHISDDVRDLCSQINEVLKM